MGVAGIQITERSGNNEVFKSHRGVGVAGVPYTSRYLFFKGSADMFVFVRSVSCPFLWCVQQY